MAKTRNRWNYKIFVNSVWANDSRAFYDMFPSKSAAEEMVASINYRTKVTGLKARMAGVEKAK